MSLDHLLDAEARQEHLASVRKSASGHPERDRTGIRNVTALAATCSQVADAAQNIMICAVDVSSHEIGEVAHMAARIRKAIVATTHLRDDQDIASSDNGPPPGCTSGF